MKQLYERHTTATTPARIDPDLRAAIEDHAAGNQLGDVLTTATAVCETRNVRLYRNGLLATITGSGDPDREHRTVALLTPRYLVIGVAGDKRGVHVRSARLETVTLSPGIVSSADSGISVVAQWSGATADQVTTAFYLGLGDDPSGHDFSSRLRTAITDAKSR
ncbi:hypothetical protein [Mycolicibacter arupensis]|uniref:hypothetical protein n=1 Tax=Mycolicibacter arupensis TaxID=342002 RepID=UPI003B3AFCE2